MKIKRIPALALVICAVFFFPPAERRRNHGSPRIFYCYLNSNGGTKIELITVAAGSKISDEIPLAIIIFSAVG